MRFTPHMEQQCFHVDRSHAHRVIKSFSLTDCSEFDCGQDIGVVLVDAGSDGAVVLQSLFASFGNSVYEFAALSAIAKLAELAANADELRVGY